MSFGGRTGKNGAFEMWGFSDVRDWFNSVIESFPAPWTIGSETHYGTEIYDSRGIHVVSIWMAFGRPSVRQQGDMSDREWDEYCCDCHWESETQWHIANAVVVARNFLADESVRWTDERAREITRDLIMRYGRWADSVYKQIACGGPNRRATK